MARPGLRINCAKSMGGTSGNSINGISPNNPKYDIYMNSCNKEFN